MGAPTLTVQSEKKENSFLGEARSLAREGKHLASAEGGGYILEGERKLEEAIEKYEDHIASISLVLKLLGSFAMEGGKVTGETLDGVIKKVVKRE